VKIQENVLSKQLAVGYSGKEVLRLFHFFWLNLLPAQQWYASVCCHMLGGQYTLSGNNLTQRAWLEKNRICGSVCTKYFLFDQL